MKTSALVTLAAALLCGALGFVIGRATVSPKQHLVFQRPAALAHARTVVVQPHSAAQIALPTASENSTKGAQPMAAQTDLLEQLEKAHTSFRTNPYNGNTFNIELAWALGLDFDQYTRLGQIAKNTEAKLNHLQQGGTTVAKSDDGTKLIVSIPTTAEQGTELYKDMISQIASVMGPDRYALFDKVSGDSLEGMFDNFGANQMHVEVSVAPDPKYPQMKLYWFKKFSDGGQWSNSWSTGTASAQQLIQLYPQLAPYLGGG